MSVFGFGVIGTGQIARAFAASLAESQRCRVVHVLGSSPAKGRAFAEQFGVARAAERVEALLDDPNVQAVYVAAPHPLHEGFTSQALARGKHVLCEKPLTLDSRAAERLFSQARAAGVVLMEAFMYRCHPVIPALLNELQAGSIGVPRRLESDFCFEVPYDPGRLFCRELGGGAIWDVGGYPVSLARLIAGTLEGRPYAEPAIVHAEGEIGPSGVDVFASAELRFESGFTARARCATRRALGNRSVIYGDRGRIELPDAWLPGGERLGKTQSFAIWNSVGGDARVLAEPPLRTVQVSAPLAPFALEAERLLDAIELGAVPFPALGAGDTLGNLRVLEAWLAALES